LGILASLHAPTARQAQQRLLIPLTLLLLLPSLGTLILPPNVQEQLMRTLAGADTTTWVWAALVGLLISDVLLVAIGLARFQRSRLIIN
jgi:hypothetical protein